ncbi:hypothetical protein [Tahibacter sp.]|uniref:hypothetical protein n=1 Tax=Tahibacter sp. TaxID=2056211 RepID=UPI0028C445A3|nr:hypothetical protein [Tahibacter sp.]
MQFGQLQIELGPQQLGRSELQVMAAFGARTNINFYIFYTNAISLQRIRRGMQTSRAPLGAENNSEHNAGGKKTIGHARRPERGADCGQRGLNGEEAWSC